MPPMHGGLNSAVRHRVVHRTGAGCLPSLYGKERGEITRCVKAARGPEPSWRIASPGRAGVCTAVLGWGAARSTQWPRVAVSPQFAGREKLRRDRRLTSHHQVAAVSYWIAAARGKSLGTTVTSKRDPPRGTPTDHGGEPSFAALPRVATHEPARRALYLDRASRIQAPMWTIGRAVSKGRIRHA
jgi:hypothetical protein